MHSNQLIILLAAETCTVHVLHASKETKKNRDEGRELPATEDFW